MPNGNSIPPNSFAVTADELIDLYHSVDPAYRASPKARFMMHDTVLAAVRKLKDGDGQYLWQPGLAGGQPSTIVDRPFSMSEYAPSTFTTGLYVGNDVEYLGVPGGTIIAIDAIEDRKAQRVSPKNPEGIFTKYEASVPGDADVRNLEAAA